MSRRVKVVQSRGWRQPWPLVTPWPCSLLRPAGLPLSWRWLWRRGLHSQPPGRWPHTPGPLPATILPPLCSASLWRGTRPPSHWPEPSATWHQRRGWVRCLFCHFLLWQLLGTESFPTLLTRGAQVALCTLSFQVTGSNVAFSEVARVAPLLSSVTLCHVPCSLVL